MSDKEIRPATSGHGPEADVWKTHEVVAAFLDERSLLIPDRSRQLEVMLRVIRFAAVTPGRVLDLGTGDGILLATTLEAFPQASGVALDFSPPMLEQARERLAQFGDRAVTVEADLRSPAWRGTIAGTYEAVLSGFAIHHLSDERKQALYAEIFDLLNDGGVFLNLEHVSSATLLGEEMFNDAMTEHLYLSRRERGDDVSFEQVQRDFIERLDRKANLLAPVEEQCRWLRDSGFRDVDCFWKCFELAIFGGFRKDA